MLKWIMDKNKGKKTYFEPVYFEINSSKSPMGLSTQLRQYFSFVGGGGRWVMSLPGVWNVPKRGSAEMAWAIFERLWEWAYGYLLRVFHKNLTEEALVTLGFKVSPKKESAERVEQFSSLVPSHVKCEWDFHFKLDFATFYSINILPWFR